MLRLNSSNLFLSSYITLHTRGFPGTPLIPAGKAGNPMSLRNNLATD